jgi:DNA (cytosine-5)-methyltransferase 1
VNTIRYIDLFAGIGGFRLGFESAAESCGVIAQCVFTSEIKPAAIKVYSDNFENIEPCDITKIDEELIPDFDVLLAGFPCQAFSSAGNRHGFADTRGTLFFDVARIIKSKQPRAVILENVEGLVNHDRETLDSPIGRTLTIILEVLQELGYKVNWNVLDASNFGLAQKRKRIFIVATKSLKISLTNFKKERIYVRDVLQAGLPTIKSDFSEKLLSHFDVAELYGKSIKDKRGGKGNIHSWDIALKGEVSRTQKRLLNELLKARRNKKWGESKGITWMDGMPLTIDEIRTFFDHPNLLSLLENLVTKGYLVYEHPKDLVQELSETGVPRNVRMPRTDLPRGYNIVTGKLSFEFSKILDPNGLCPTIVATDVDRIGVIDGQGIRKLSEIEQLRLFGFPDNFKLRIKEREKFDLFGNTVPVAIVKAVSVRVLESLFDSNVDDSKVDEIYYQDKLLDVKSY